MHADSIGPHALHKIDKMPTNRRKKKRQTRNRKTEKTKRLEEFTTGTVHINSSFGLQCDIYTISSHSKVFSRVCSA